MVHCKGSRKSPLLANRPEVGNQRKKNPPHWDGLNRRHYVRLLPGAQDSDHRIPILLAVILGGVAFEVRPVANRH
jgi:hypothetical protein